MAASTPSAPSPQLSFSTNNPGIPIEIDGVAYSIRHPATFSLGQLRRIDAVYKRVQALPPDDQMTDAQTDEAAEILGAVCCELVDAPRAVVDRLGQAQQLMVLVAFSTLRPNQPTPARTGAPTTRRPSRGTKRSPASRGSTGARGRTGSGTRR